MTLFGAREEGDLAEVRDFIASTAGAELNVAVGLRRLGQQPVYMTRLGLDPFGERILGFMRNNDLDTSMVGRDEFRPTGIMFKSKVEHGDPVTFYCRAGSAASALSPIDIQSIDWQVVSVLHMTGILPPLSDLTFQASYALVRAAHQHGIFVSFDPNLRPALWPDTDTMRATLRELASQADLVMPGLTEGHELFGADTPESVARAFLDNGAKTVVVKDGPRGALAANKKVLITCRDLWSIMWWTQSAAVTGSPLACSPPYLRGKIWLRLRNAAAHWARFKRNTNPTMRLCLHSTNWRCSSRRIGVLYIRRKCDRWCDNRVG